LVISQHRKFKQIKACFGKGLNAIKRGDFVKAYRSVNIDEQRAIRNGVYFGKIIFLYETCCHSVVALIEIFNKGSVYADDVKFVWEEARHLERTTKEEALVDLL
jgi:hypothetical protein